LVSQVDVGSLLLKESTITKLHKIADLMLNLNPCSISRSSTSFSAGTIGTSGKSVMREKFIFKTHNASSFAPAPTNNFASLGALPENPI
jgi:hypothetical protein